MLSQGSPSVRHSTVTLASSRRLPRGQVAAARHRISCRVRVTSASYQRRASMSYVRRPVGVTLMSRRCHVDVTPVSCRCHVDTSRRRQCHSASKSGSVPTYMLHPRILCRARDGARPSLPTSKPRSKRAEHTPAAYEWRVEEPPAVEAGCRASVSARQGQFLPMHPRICICTCFTCACTCACACACACVYLNLW